MRSFSKKIVLFLITLVLFELFLTFLLEPVTYQHYISIELKNAAKEGKSPDTIVIGNSSVEMGFVPSVIEAGTKENDFVLNAATGSQMIWGSYYYLKDLFKTYEVKNVMVGIEYGGFVEQKERVPKRDLVVLERIQSPIVKAEYAYNHLEWKEYPELITSYHYREQVGAIADTVKAKLNKNYWLGVDTREKSFYKERGYVQTEARGEVHTGIYGWDEVDINQISPKAIEYLDKIVELCEENGAQLYLVVPPVAFTGIYYSQSYQSCYDYFAGYAKEKGVTFWDLNLIKDRVERLPDAMLSDADHLGEEGAIICSSLYSELVEAQKAGKDTSEYFYGSLDEMKADIHGIVECDLWTEPFGENGDRMMNAKSIHQSGCIPEYEYWVCEKGGEWVKLQAYSESTKCLIPAQYLEGGVYFLLNCRQKGSTKEWERSTQAYREPGM